MKQKKNRRGAERIRLLLAVLLLSGMVFPALFGEQSAWSGDKGRAEAEEMAVETEKNFLVQADISQSEGKSSESPAGETEETLQKVTEDFCQDSETMPESEKIQETDTESDKMQTEMLESETEMSSSQTQNQATEEAQTQQTEDDLAETEESEGIELETEIYKEETGTNGAGIQENDSERPADEADIQKNEPQSEAEEAGIKTNEPERPADETESEIRETEKESGSLKMEANGLEKGEQKNEIETNEQKAESYESEEESETEGETEEDLSFLLDEQWRDGPIRKVSGISLFTAQYPTVSRDDSEIFSYLGFPCYFKYVTNHGMSVGGKTVAAYCLYNTREAPEDERYTHDGEGSLSKEITYCLYSGCRYRGSTAYNSKYSSGNWKKDYYITQMAIHIINHDQGRESSIEDYLDQSKDKEVYGLVYKMVEDAYADTEIASSVTNQTKEVTYEITPSKQEDWEKQANGTYRTAKSYTCKSNEPDRILEVTRSLGKGTPQGVTIVAEDPNDPLSPFYLKATQAAYQTIARDKITVTVTVTVTAQEYGGWWYEPADSSVKRQAVTYLSMDYTELEEKRQVTAVASELFFGVKIQKKETGTGTLLKGAVYGLYKDEACGSLLYTFPPTDEDGRTQLLNLQAAQETYYVREITAPAFHVLNKTVYKVQADQEEITIQVEDKPQTASLTIWKEGEVLTGAAAEGGGMKFLYENRRISGAVFTLYAEEAIQNAAGEKVYSKGDVVRDNIRSGTDGSAVITGLPFGVYSLVEKQAPAGMAKSQERHRIELKAPGQTEEVSSHTVTVKNTRTKVRIKIFKSDAETKNPLKGARFGLYTGEAIKNISGQIIAQANSLIVSGTTGADGFLYFETEIPWGYSYYVLEQQAPSGYVRNTGARFSLEFQGTGGQAVQEFSYMCTNQSCRATVKLQKVDLETGKPIPQGDAVLQGAVYGIFAREDIVHPDGKTGVLHKAGEQAAVLVSDESGSAEAKGLYPGKYFLKELQAPEGYLLDGKEYDISCTWENDQTPVIERKVTVEEQVKKQPFQLIKISQEGTDDAPLLQGAGFTVYLLSQLKPDGEGGYLLDQAQPVVIGRGGETELFTDETGYLQTIPLPYGKYLVRETTVPQEYKPVKDFFVTVSEHSPSEPQPWRVLLDEHFQAKLKVVKRDQETGEMVKIPGAKFQIVNRETGEYVKQTVTYPDRETLDTFVTNEEGYLILPENLLPGKYCLIETEAPEGYVRNEEPLEFEISSGCAYETDSLTGDAVIVQECMDQPVKGEIRIRKSGEIPVKDEEGLSYKEVPLEGVVFDVYAAEDILYADGRNGQEGEREILFAKGTLVASAVTDEKGEASAGNLPLGKYEIRERKPPETFLVQKEEVVAELLWESQETPLVLWEKDWKNIRQILEIRVEKKDSENGNPIEGTEFSLYASEDILGPDGALLFEKGEKVSQCTTNEKGEGVFDDDLPHGKYEIREEKAAPGYVSSQEIWEVDAEYQDGTEEVLKAAGIFENDRTDLQIFKMNLTDGEAVEGASLEVKDSEGEVIDQWISGKEPHRIRGLEVGKTYFLTETLPAPGYVTAETVEFTVEDTGEVQKVVMKDDVTKVEISKQDITDGSELAGASLSVLDEEGEKVESWVSGEEPHRIQGLEAGKTYFLTETLPAPGYVTAETVEFTVEDTGEIQKVVMKDDVTKVEISKQDITDGSEVIGASLSVLDEEGEIVESWVSGEEPHMLLKLPAGVYTLREETAPYGYLIAEEVNFTVEDTGEIQKVVMKDEYPKGRLLLEKTDQDTGKGLSGAVFELRDEEGKVIQKLTTDREGKAKSSLLEAAIYEDGAFQRELMYFLEEIQPPEGYQKEETVWEISFKYLDGETDEIERKEKIENSRIPAQEGDTPQTGDRTKPELWVGLAGAGFLAVLLLFRGKRAGRRRRDA
ncbi:MAG TPA: hypothetical protein IAB84_04705 [Candidatus Choladousia intestinigallinarum]|nr:hypothetical protein [Candidatus Choladousia intestinigallinarum]